MPIYNQENQLEGVLFSDLLLSLISNFLKDLSVSKTGEIIIWFFILLIALFLALWTTNYITKPILLLDRALSNFQKGNHQSPNL